MSGGQQRVFSPVRPRRTSEEIILQIQQAILDGHLGSGDQLPSERDLAETFNVSRSALREALRVLEAMGALTARRGVGPQSGTVVGGSTENPLSTLLLLFVRLRNVPLLDLVETREALEMLNARRAAAEPAPDRAAELRRLVGAMEKATDFYTFHRLDTDFHVAVATLSGNSLSPLLMEALREAMGREMLKAFPALPDWTAERSRLVSEHASIASAIAGGDGDSAATAVVAHIRGFYTRLLEPPSGVAAP
jgi:GntR family transcriptional repressor for pyruvate dehydrogenase complex